MRKGQDMRWTILLLLALPACRDAVTTPEIPQPAAISIVSGRDQVQGRGRELHESVVVRAEDGSAMALPGVVLTFQPESGSGTVSAASVLTDSLGQAGVEWTLGDVVATQTLIVSSEGGSARVVVAATARPGDFDIQIAADTGFAAEQLAAIHAGLERWAAVIVNDLPDHPFPEGYAPTGHCADHEELEIPAGGSIDDVLVGVGIERTPNVAFRYSICAFRFTTRRPILVYFGIGEEYLARLDLPALTDFTVHSVGHMLGFGFEWGRNQVRNRVRDLGEGANAHFPDPETVAAFDASGGAAWDGGSKVPVENRGASWLTDVHWRSSVMSDEVMSSGHHFAGTADLPLSAITVQAMATLGYEVDVSMADPYTIPAPSTARNAPSLHIREESESVRLMADPVEIFDEMGRLVGIVYR